MLTKAKSQELARRILAGGSYACRDDGTPDTLGVHRRVRYEGEWIVLYGMSGRPPSHGDMVRQLALALREPTERT